MVLNFEEPPKTDFKTKVEINANIITFSPEYGSNA